LKPILRIISWYNANIVLQALLISFREGLESFLIIGVISTYLRRTGRASLLRGVHLGLAISLLTCTLGAYLWYLWMQSETGGPNQSKWEGFAALIAAVLVGGLLWQTVRTGKRLKGEIEERVARVADASRGALLGVTLVTALLVTREGMEAVLFLGVQAFAAKAAAMTIGAALGLAGAAGVAWVWSRYGHRLQIGLVLKVTSIFLGIFLVQLLIYGAHELAESGMIQGSEAFHDATERLGPQGDIGQWITFSLLGAPLVYLVLSRLGRRRSLVSGGGAQIAVDRAAVGQGHR
jgi:high-affinity iron transporter